MDIEIQSDPLYSGYGEEDEVKKHISFFIFLCLLMTSTWGCQTKNSASGIGDPYYPELGNDGYDVQSYIIALAIDPMVNIVSGSTTISANSTKRLRSFNLDFHGLTVDAVKINDKPAEFSRFNDELIIMPPRPLDANSLFTTVVDYHGTPSLIESIPIRLEMGWSHADDGSINVWGEPDAASTWFPNNNHPRDKAAFRFEITVPKPWMVAASGYLRETIVNGDKTRYVWEMDQPMATYLASISIDQYELFTQPGPNGITIRSYFPNSYPSSLRTNFDILPEVITFYEEWFGPYPFKEYGVVIGSESGICKTAPMALEAQSMSIHCPSPALATEPVIVHELAHQWFGNSVSLENWKDIWLKEGLCTYAEWLWLSKNDPDEMLEIVKSQSGLYYYDSKLSVAEPAADNLYYIDTFVGGGEVFYALQLEVGDETFKQIIQTYTERYRYGNAGTDEFIAIAEEVSGQNLEAFFDMWLFSEKSPDLPK